MKNFSIEALIQWVEDCEKMSKVHTLYVIDLENAALERKITAHQKQWCCIMELVDQTQTIVVALQLAIQQCIDERVAAEKSLLSFWGIERTPSGPKKGPNGRVDLNSGCW